MQQYLSSGISEVIIYKILSKIMPMSVTLSEFCKDI